MKYKFIPHTADAEFQAFGKNLGEAFANAAEAMIAVMIDPETIKPNIKKKISIESESKESLLYDFLEQFLILLDSDMFILKKVEDIEIIEGKTYKLEAGVVGDEFSYEKYETKTMVKAVTYNDMLIKEEANKVTVQVVVDV